MKRESNLQIYLREMGKVALLTPAEEKEYGLLCWRGNRRARERLIRSNLRLVVHIAKDFKGRGLPFEDLIEEGNIGLIKAVDKYNPRRHNLFCTYASWWIKCAIRNALMNCYKPLQVPHYLIELLAKWKLTSEQLAQKLSRTPRPYEIIKAIDVPPEKIKILKRVLKNGPETGRIFSLELLKSAEAVLPDRKSKSAEDELLDKSDIELINKLLSHIDQKAAQVMRLRYGLDLPAEKRIRQAPRSLSQVGKITKMSRERVRQVLEQTFSKIHYQLNQLTDTD
jgi:RNA polymerase primary sigma factor